MKEGEEGEVSRLATSVFLEFVAPDFLQKGIEEFIKQSTQEAISERSKENNCFMVAKDHKKIIGVIGLRDCRHIAMLFVEKDYQNKGIGKKLVEKSITLLQAANPDLKELTVSAAPKSLSFYERIGFLKTGPEKLENGMSFTPMSLKLR